ncbi:MAG TPA: terminase family protein [Allocoleopsis sp.]
MVLNEIIVDDTYIRRMEEFRKPDKSKGLLENCSNNVVLFAEKMLGIKMYSWQIDLATRIQNAMVDKSLTREYLALTSRQIGKSTVAAIITLWSCVFNKYPGTLQNNTRACIISATDAQAKKLLHDIEILMITGDNFMKITYIDNDGKPLFGDKFFTNLLDTTQANNTSTITFKAYNPKTHGLLLKDSKVGSSIKSYPPTNIVLGETFSLIIEDEAGLSEKITDEFHYEYIYPTGNSTNAIRIYTSTPWVTSGFFYRLADPNDVNDTHPADRLMFTIDAIKIENPNYYTTVMKTVDDMNKDGKTSEVQRAYYCRFVQGEQNYFNPDAVFECFDESLFMREGFKGECDLGIDFGGQVISKTVVTISTMDEDGSIKRLYHKSYEVGKDLSLLDDIKELLKHFNVQRIVPDECPAGDFLIRKMIEFGWNITPMNFRSEKVKKYGSFRAKLNRGLIKSYVDDNLKIEMLALEFANTARNTIIQHAPNYTDDLIDSFLLSTYHYITEDNSFDYFDVDDLYEKE